MTQTKVGNEIEININKMEINEINEMEIDINKI